jgi:hypothetical protein
MILLCWFKTQEENCYNEELFKNKF